MRPFPAPVTVPQQPQAPVRGPRPDLLPGQITYQRDPQAVYEGESITQTLRQLDAYGRDGLPVLSGDGSQVLGWITNASVLQAVAAKIGTSPRPTAPTPASEPTGPGSPSNPAEPATRLPGRRDPPGARLPGHRQATWRHPARSQ